QDFRRDWRGCGQAARSGVERDREGHRPPTRSPIPDPRSRIPAPRSPVGNGRPDRSGTPERAPPPESMSSERRLGVLGGTFDPIHYGHLRAGEAVETTLALDEIRVIPLR